MGINLGEAKKGMEAADLQDSVLKHCIRARLHLINVAPHLGSAAMHTDFREEPNCLSNGVPTMATDGVYIYYHPDYLTGGALDGASPDDDILATVAHETYHNLLLHTHPSRQGKPGERDHMLWNYACDYAVNAILVEEGFKIGKNWLYKKEWTELCAEEIYEILLKEKQKSIQKLMKMIGDGKLADKHIPFGGPSQGSGNEQKDAQGNPIPAKEDPSADKLAEEWRGRLIDAMTQKDFMEQMNGGKKAGTVSGELEEVINSIKRVKTDVVQILSNHITRRLSERSNWNRPNKRWLGATGQYWPSKIDESISVGVLMDTSGSVTNEDASFMIGVLHDIISNLPVKWLRYMEIDTSIKKDITMDGVITFPEPKIKGRGGTDFRPPFAKLAEDPGNFPDVVVYLTDGQGPFPEEEPPYPVLWVYNHKDRTTPAPPWGELTRFDRRDMEAYGYATGQDGNAAASPSR